MTLGSSYLNEYSDDTAVDMLLDQITENIHLDENILMEFRQIQIEKIVMDFKASNTILLNGWFLSITEARQCATLTRLVN